MSAKPRILVVEDDEQVQGLLTLLAPPWSEGVQETGEAHSVLMILMAGDVLALWTLRGRWDRAVVLAMVPGAVLGVAAASLFLGGVDDRVVEVVLAVLSLVFVVYRLVEPRLLADPPVPGRRGALVAGLASGVTSTVAHAGGPPVAAYLLAARVEAVRLVPLAVFLVPGVLVGRRLVDRVDRRLFERVVLSLLVLGALYLLVA